MENKLTKKQKVYFLNEMLPYKVKALSDRYAIVSRKFNKKEDNDLIEFQVEMGAYCTKKEAYQENKENPVYSILDFKENIRGVDNIIFGVYDYFNEEDCEKVIKDLENGEIELSRRNKADLNIDWERTLLSK